MKQLILVLLTFFYFSSIKAQDNPYEIFGYKNKVKYETKISEYYIVRNSDTTSVTKSMVFNLDFGYVLFLNEKDSIINKTKIEPNQLLRWLSVDPLTSDYPSLAPYNFVANNPINAIDPDGRKILFVNGYWNSYIGGLIGSSKGGKDYWSSNFATKAQGFFNDYSKIGDNNYIDGSSNWGGDMSGEDRFNAGMEYAKANLEVLTADMVEGETIKMVTHSEGGAYGAGIAQYLIDQGYKVETIVHLSTDEGDEFSTPKAPTTYQLGYQGDWVTGNKRINGVDKSGLVNSGLGWQYVHGSTKNGSVFDEVQDLITVRTQDNIGMVNGKAAAWKTQVSGTTPNGTDFTRINGIGILNEDGTIKK